MRRQVALEFAAPLTQGAIDALAHAAVLGRAAAGDAQPALETERQADIHQLQDVGVLAGILMQLVQDFVEALAADHLVVEGADHAALRPRALAAPGRAENEIVDGGAEGVVRRPHELAAADRWPRHWLRRS